MLSSACLFELNSKRKENGVDLKDASLNSNSDFELQIVRNLPFLRKIASKYLKNEEDQKDLIQDTVYKALKNKHKYSPDSNLRGWLFTVLKNTFVNQYHREKNRGFTIEMDLLKHQGNQIHNSIQFDGNRDNGWYDHSNFPDDYCAIMNGLSLEVKSIVIMCAIEGFSYQQISEHMHCPIGTIRSRLYRSRKLMVRSYRKLIRDGEI